MNLAVRERGKQIKLKSFPLPCPVWSRFRVVPLTSKAPIKKVPRVHVLDGFRWSHIDNQDWPSHIDSLNGESQFNIEVWSVFLKVSKGWVVEHLSKDSLLNGSWRCLIWLGLVLMKRYESFRKQQWQCRCDVWNLTPPPWEGPQDMPFTHLVRPK